MDAAQPSIDAVQFLLGSARAGVAPSSGVKTGAGY
jgi:hypothetical protein